MKLIQFGLLTAALFSMSILHGQGIKSINFESTEITESMASLVGTPQIQANNAKYFIFNLDFLQDQLEGVMHREFENSGFIAQLSLPHPDGTFHLYNAKANSTMHPELAAKFPNIKSYDAAGVNNQSFVKWDLTPQGLHVMIMTPGESTIFIDPLVKGNTEYYIVYRKNDFITSKIKNCSFNSDFSELQTETSAVSGNVKSFGTCELRTYRLALSATGEYSIFHGGTLALAQAAQVTTMNRVNGIFEKDMAITMEIIPNNDLIIYTSTADPFTNGTPGTMINQNQTNTDNVIGNGNYDIGHVFGTNSGGLAGLGVVCNNANKARGVTGSSAPIGDSFDVDYVGHEMGHQFGGNHTFNNSCNNNRNNATAVEPGSGITIMGYAGICAPDIQNFGDDHYSGISLEEFDNEILSAGHTCEVITTLANSAPTITSTNGNITVPANTPFALTAIASDPDGDLLTYNWEQMNNEISTQPPVANATGGPNFRSLPSSTSPTRYFPNLVDLANGGPFTWEVIPSVTRTMNFRLTLRDNSSAAGGCNDHTDVTLTTDAGSGPFIVNYPSVTGISWLALTGETVLWDIANTDVAPVNCVNVDVLLSVDGGLTYPYTLATNTPNDGSQLITVPNVPTTTARIMVISASGTFFDISDNDFEIVALTNDYTLSATPGSGTVCQPNDITYTIDIGSLDGYSDLVDLSVSGVPAGATSLISPASVTPAGTASLLISNTGLAAAGTYTLTVNATSTSGPKTFDVELIIGNSNPAAVALISPADGAVNETIPTNFTWNASSETGVTYDIEIATDLAFASIVDASAGLATPSYSTSALSGNITYYWRVMYVTPCGTSAWSSVFSFTTNGCSTYVSIDTPIIIPAAGTPTITSVINIPTGGTINDVNLTNVNGTHAWIKNLTFTLTSPLGTVVPLFSQICNNQDNFDVGFDDASALTVLPCPPTDGQVYQPTGTLASFNGEDAAGNWVLTIVDGNNNNGGELLGWTLEVCVDPVVGCTDSDIPVITANTTICEGSLTTLSILSGNLNDATDWTWYEGSCGGTIVGTGTSVDVSPTLNATYFVRGEGGCVILGACSQVDVTVMPIYNETASASICQGNTYLFGTQAITTAGTYTELFASIDGCDSIVILTLSVNTSFNETASATICQGNIYLFGTQTLTTSGTYTELFTSTGGCDSTVLLTLSVITSFNETASATICQGNTYSFGTQALTTSGTYTELFTSTGGCDSTVILTLSVITSFNETATASICQGDTYLFGTQTLAAAGTFTELFTSSGGCDSTVILTLSVNTSYNETASATICQGDTYLFGTQTLAAAGTFTELFTSVGGCDSTVILTLSVNTSYNETASAVICQGDTYLFGTQTLINAGVFTELFTSIGGCDSLVILTIAVTPSYNELASATICQGNSYLFGTQTLTTSGTYTELFNSAGGCDSSVVLTLAVITAFNETATAAVCQGDSYLFGTQTLTNSGTYTELFTSTGGCDSTVMLNLIVTPSSVITESINICEGNQYTFPDGSFGTTTEAHISVLTSISGCDSTVVTALTVYPSYNMDVFVSICSGGSHVFPDGSVGSTSQTQTSVLTSSLGCDSLIITNLVVNSSSNSNESVTICEGDTHVFPDGTIGTTNQVYTSVISTTEGCDSIIVTTLNVSPVTNETVNASMCDGDTYTFPDGSSSSIAQTQNSVLLNSAGCDSIITTILTVETIDISVTNGGATLTANQQGATYQWIDCADNNLPISGETGISFTSTASVGNYAVEVTLGGCTEISDCILIDKSGIQEFTTQNVEIYPNPATDNITIVWSGEVTFIEITDTKGKILQRVSQVSGTEKNISLSNFAQGVYFIHVGNEQTVVVKTMVKQ
jgi:subtilisin-like proprotein convertase family protein